jgi:hypothetical protein
MYIVPNNKTSRRLATWWEEHQAADKLRVAYEKAKKHKAKLRASALAKLTPAEKAALGLGV